MTAPLSATNPALAATTPAPRQAAKAAKAESFALPDPAAEDPGERLPRVTAAAQSEPGADTPLPAFAPPPAEAPPLAPPPALPVALEVAPPNLPGAPQPEAETAAPQEAEAAASPATSAPPLATAPALPRPKAVSPIAPASTRTPEAPQGARDAKATPVEAIIHPAPAPGRAAGPAASQPLSASPPSESSGQPQDQPPGRNPHSPARQAAVALAAADAPAQLPPFRVEPAGVATQPIAPPVVEQAAATPAPASPAATPDMAAEPAVHMPDIVVDLVGESAIDVTISAVTADSLERLAAAEPELRLELTGLGAEVEAIRMELRPEPGAEKGAEQSADKIHASATDESAGRQGDRMMRHNGQSEDRQQLRAARLRNAQAGGAEPQQAQAALPANAGRIDRYA